MLFRNIDEPGLASIKTYRKFGGYESIRKAYEEMTPEEVLKELEDSGLRGRGGAGFSMGKKASFLPRGDMDKYLCCNADESEPGAFKDRELMQKNPHQLIEGIIIAARAAGRQPLLHLHPRRVRPAGRHPRAGGRGGLRGRLPRRGRARHRRAGRARRPPRRRRLHLRRGDGAARLARGQARQPAAEAAVPGRPGPLRRADADQQRRDPLQRAAHHRLGRRVVHAASAPSSRPGTKVVSVSRRRAAARQLRGRARHRDQAADQRPRRRPAAGSQDQGHLPRRLLLAGACSRTRPSTSPTASRRCRRRARCSAPARSSSSTTPPASSSWPCGPRASTTTSPAASARPAARAPTGP